MKRFTIGITTHNEERSISALLEALANLGPQEVDIILYDDCSNDNTRTVIESHSIARQPNFHAHFADFNNGTPSVGRTYIGQNAKTEYVALIDGDDHVAVEQFRKLIAEAPSGFDMILTTFLIRGTKRGFGKKRAPVIVNNDAIMHLISGIGGKIYRSALLAEYGHDDTKGRSDDARLNMRILAGVEPKILTMPDICFYFIEESRKSARVKSINFDEVAARIKKYEALQAKYSVDKRYLAVLKRNLRKTIREDETVGQLDKEVLLGRLNDIFRFSLERIVLIGSDVAAIGGIPLRLRRTIMAAAQGREVEYVLLCRSGEKGLPNTISIRDAERLLDRMKSWSENDTVVLTANNLLRAYPPEIQAKLLRLPLIYMCSAQMAFMIQDSDIIADEQYVDEFRCSQIISFSDADIFLQRQFGIHGQVKGFLPVATRETNAFRSDKNTRLGYVGRIDFHAKGCERLIDVAHAARNAGLPPIRLFTVEDTNSPDYNEFMQLIVDEGLEDQFEITLRCSEPDVIYSDLSFVLLPSKKESFGNVVLEAFSYGIPVVSTSYAPGPAELIENGKTGFLLDNFSGDEVVKLVLQTSESRLKEMSAAAFEKHKKYSMESHLNFIETTATNVLNEFTGKNLLSVFPKLKLAQEPGHARRRQSIAPAEQGWLQEELDLAEDEIRSLRGEIDALRIARMAGSEISDTFSSRRKFYLKGHQTLSNLTLEIKRLERGRRQRANLRR